MYTWYKIYLYINITIINEIWYHFLYSHQKRTFMKDKGLIPLKYQCHINTLPFDTKKEVTLALLPTKWNTVNFFPHPKENNYYMMISSVCIGPL